MRFFDFTCGIGCGVIELNYFLAGFITCVGNFNACSNCAVLGNLARKRKVTVRESRVGKSVTERIQYVVVIPLVGNCTRLFILLVSSRFIVLVAYIDTLFVNYRITGSRVSHIAVVAFGGKKQCVTCGRN